MGIDIEGFFNSFQQAMYGTEKPKVMFANGRVLNEILKTEEYDTGECYMVTADSIEVYNPE